MAAKAWVTTANAITIAQIVVTILLPIVFSATHYSLTPLVYYDKIKTMIIIGEKRREFIGKMVSDLGKAIVTVALASYFFKEFPFILRIVVTILGFILLLVSIIIVPEKEDR